MARPALVKARDINVVRQYTVHGISLLVEINFAKKKMSFVEVDMAKGGYKPKKWLFAEREPGYLKTWAKIFDAQKRVTEVVVEELEAIKDSEMRALIKALAETGRMK